MQYTYAASANNTTNGVSLGAAGQDVRVYKVLIGLPVASGSVTLFNKATAFNNDTADRAFRTTLPATISSSYTYAYETVYDFGAKGLQLDGGNLQVDQAMQVTVVWDFAPTGPNQ